MQIFGCRFCKYRNDFQKCYNKESICWTPSNIWYGKIVKPTNDVLSLLKYNFQKCYNPSVRCSFKAFNKYCTLYGKCGSAKK